MQQQVATIVALSLSILAAALFLTTAIYWFPVWRKYKKGLPHALFLTNMFLGVSSIFRAIQSVCQMARGGGGNSPFNLIIVFIVFFVSVFQYALSRGYFNWKE